MGKRFISLSADQAGLFAGIIVRVLKIFYPQDKIASNSITFEKQNKLLVEMQL